MKRTLYNECLPKVSLTFAERSSNTAVNGTTVDRSEFKNFCKDAMVLVQTGTITDGTHTITLEESDNGSGWSTVTTLQGTAPVITDADSNKLYTFGYTGSKRYLRVVATTATADDGGVFGAIILLGNARRKPIARA